MSEIGEGVEEVAAVAETAGPVTVENVADGVEHGLDPRALTVERLGGAIALLMGGLPLLVVTVGITLLVGARRGPLILLPLGALLQCLYLAWSVLVWARRSHESKRYRIDAGGMAIRRGVLWREEIHVPRSRVQHTEVSQGPLERHFGLGTLHVFTAGTEYARVTLGGLEHATAIRIRDHLLPRSNDDGV